VSISTPESLTPRHDVSRFSCGKPQLDHWLKTRALTNQQRGFTAVVVVHIDGQVVGYYGLAPTSVVPTVLPRSIRTGQPPNPVPCILLGQLAIDVSYAGQGLGTSLLRHALERSVQASRLIGGRALIVQAIDNEAVLFWKRHGFTPRSDDQMILVSGMIEVEETVRRGNEF
jgi:GNAT superfamily N-acetyltransferase